LRVLPREILGSQDLIGKSTTVPPRSCYRIRPTAGFVVNGQPASFSAIAGGNGQKTPATKAGLQIKPGADSAAGIVLLPFYRTLSADPQTGEHESDFSLLGSWTWSDCAPQKGKHFDWQNLEEP
jgi:hypothetical protein